MSAEVFGFSYSYKWDYENGFYLTSDLTRIAKQLAHYELYKSIVGLPGHVIECGVYKGASLVRFATFRQVLESEFSRKIVGFDAFGAFPRQGPNEDIDFIEKFEEQGGEGIPKEELQAALDNKGFRNVELIKGNILESLPAYIEAHPELRVSLLHIDVDVYEPSKVILETLYDRVVPGGLVVLDDYATVEGETRAVDEYFDGKAKIEKLSISHIPAFIRK